MSVPIRKSLIYSDQKNVGTHKTLLWKRLLDRADLYLNRLLVQVLYSGLVTEAMERKTRAGVPRVDGSFRWLKIRTII